jgi:hypothetical protein
MVTLICKNCSVVGVNTLYWGTLCNPLGDREIGGLGVG